MAVVSMKQLLEAGVHFGHQTRRWNPKMKRFIFGERNGIYIIDLNQTLQRIETAYTFTRDLVADGGTILFIGTKKQTQDPIARYAEACGMPYVNERWLGGMLTNFTTISARVKKMQEYERMRAAGDFDAMPKKEALILSRELEKLERNLGGIRTMSRLPEAVFVIDTKKEHLAVTEANKLGIPVVAIVDTNCDPDLVQYVIPGNDDAIRAANLMCRVIADGVEEGRFIASRRAARTGGGAEAGPMALSPEEQARRDAEQAEARRQFAEQARQREARLAATQAQAPDTEAPATQAPATETESVDADTESGATATPETPAAELQATATEAADADADAEAAGAAQPEPEPVPPSDAAATPEGA
jgi:small subunit ribosomal protein S2